MSHSNNTCFVCKLVGCSLSALSALRGHQISLSLPLPPSPTRPAVPSNSNPYSLCGVWTVVRAAAEKQAGPQGAPLARRTPAPVHRAAVLKGGRPSAARLETSRAHSFPRHGLDFVEKALRVFWTPTTLNGKFIPGSGLV